MTSREWCSYTPEKNKHSTLRVLTPSLRSIQFTVMKFQLACDSRVYFLASWERLGRISVIAASYRQQPSHSVSACWSQSCALHKRMNRSKCRLKCGLAWTLQTTYLTRGRIPQGLPCDMYSGRYILIWLLRGYHAAYWSVWLWPLNPSRLP